MRAPLQAALLVLLSAAGLLGAAEAQRASPPHDTLPPVGVELVQIDAVVTDKQGRPVPGLTKADFEVREDGKLQDLSVFGMEGHPDAEVMAADTAVAAPKAPAPAPSSAAPKVRGRQIVIAVDDLHIAPANLVSARAALLRFVDEQLSTDDEVALVTTSGTVGLSQELTRDRTALRRAIERLSLIQLRSAETDEAPHLTEYQAEQIDRGDPEAVRLAVQEILQDGSVDEQMAGLQAAQKAQRMLFEIMSYSGQTLSSLEGVVRGLAPLAGRKLVVLASDGFLIGLGSSDTRHYDLRRIVDAATRSGVVVYALDTRGLVSFVPGGDASFGGPQVLTAPGQRMSLQSRSIEALRDSLVALSEDTGGFLAKNSNDLSAGLASILRDNLLYYLLGYEPTNKKRDGKFRKIEVRLASRPELKDLKIRTRKGYFAPADRKALQAQVGTTGDESSHRERQFAQALGSLIPLRGIPVRLVVDYVDLPPDGSRAVVKALVDVRNVAFERTETGYEAELEVAGAVFDESGRRVSEIAGERSRLRLPLDNAQAIREQGLLYEKAIALAPGRYQVRLAARDVRGSTLGNASGWVEIPDRNASPLSLSSVFLNADDGDSSEGASSLTDVQVEKHFGHEQGLHYLVYVYRSDAAAAEPADVILQAQVWSGEKLQGVGPTHKVAFAGPGEPAPRQAERIALEPLPPGEYELRIVVTDRKTGQKAVQRSTFTHE